MSFKLNQSETYDWPVPLLIPTDNGKKIKANFDATFRRLTQTRINAIVRQAKAFERSRVYDEEAELQDQDTAREILAGWNGVLDDDDEQIPFSESALNKMLDIPTVAAQIVRAWFESIDIAKRKN
jgi:hypothetical protein